MLVHQFKIILNFLYGCRFFTWLIYSNYYLIEIRLIQGNFQFWMSCLSEIVWRLSWYVCTPDSNNSEFLVCLSVGQLSYFLTESTQIQGYLQFWMRSLSKFFWTHSCDDGTLVPKNLNIFYVCQSVSWLNSLLKLYKYGDISSSG